MLHRVPLVLVIFFVFFFQENLKSQSNLTIDVLQKVGGIDSLYSESLKEYRTFYVQFPANYQANSSEKYPVAFVLDGEILLPTAYNVQSFYSGGFTPEMILIGISNANNRTRDLTTSKVKEMYGGPFNGESGGASAFIKFIETELIPDVEAKYPVTNFRTLRGHSYGGLFTLYTLINHSHLFSNYIAIDPSLDWDNQKLLSESQEKLATINYKGKSLFMSLGGQLHFQNPKVTIDNVMDDSSEFTLFSRSNIAFSNLVKENNKNGLAFEWKFYPRDLHGTIPFPSIMDGLIFNFEWYRMENTAKFNSPNTSKEELSKLINYRAEKLKRYFNYTVPPYPEDLMNALGYMSLDMGNTEKSKMFFEFLIQFYPNNANSYDSMADYYERNKDYDNALKFVRKAYEISGSDYHKERIEKFKRKK
jgi:predicted alpha/beta superfamily hydrolase